MPHPIFSCFSYHVLFFITHTFFPTFVCVFIPHFFFTYTLFCLHSFCTYCFVCSPLFIFSFHLFIYIWLSLGTGGDKCECRNEPSGSIKCGEFLDQQRNCKLLKKDSAPWSQFNCNASLFYFARYFTFISLHLPSNFFSYTFRFTAADAEQNWAAVSPDRAPSATDSSPILCSHRKQGSPALCVR